jgi:hypothetical protein
MSRFDPRCFGPAVCDFEFMVPADYDHDTQIEDFVRKTKPLATTYHFDGYLNRKNFTQVATRLEPGKKYRIRMFPVVEVATTGDCLGFLEEKNAVLVTAQGITLLQSHHPDKFPIFKWVVSLDERDYLWEYVKNPQRATLVHHRPNNEWEFRLANFGFSWCNHLLLCFSEK